MRVTSLLILLLCAVHATAKVKSEKNAQGETVWELTTYLKGTSAEVGKSLNAEVIRLNEQITKTKAAIEDDKALLNQHRANAIAEYLSNSAYKKAQADVVVHKKAMDEARARGDRTESMYSSSKYNTARNAAERFEQNAEKYAEDSKLVKADRARLSDSEKKLAHLEKGLADAEKWRNEVVSAIRNTFELRWPFAVGDTGTLGEIIPSKISPNGEITAHMKLHEPIRQDDGHREGIVTISYRAHHAVVVLRGSKLTDVTPGKPIRVDRSIEVQSVKVSEDGETIIFTVQARNDALDELMRAITLP